MDKLSRTFGLAEPLKEAIAGGLPVYGTCAGLIMLADRILDGISGQQTLGGLDVDGAAQRLRHPRLDSFETDLDIPALGDPAVHAVFIRAPVVERVGEQATPSSRSSTTDGSSRSSRATCSAPRSTPRSPATRGSTSTSWTRCAQRHEADRAARQFRIGQEHGRPRTAPDARRLASPSSSRTISARTVLGQQKTDAGAETRTSSLSSPSIFWARSRTRSFSRACSRSARLRCRMLQQLAIGTRVWTRRASDLLRHPVRSETRTPHSLRATRDKAGSFGAEELRQWYVEIDLLPFVQERRITAHESRRPRRQRGSSPTQVWRRARRSADSARPLGARAADRGPRLYNDQDL